MITDNKRFIVKRSTIAGVVPTIPSLSATSQTDHTLGGWTNTDLYNGELFANTTDKRVWARLGNDIVELGYSGMTGSFLNLSDTPSSYSGSSLMYVRVNSGATGLEFTTLSATSVFTQLTDVPSSYAGYSGYGIVVNGTETGLEFVQVQRTLTGLTDVSITGYTPGNIIAVHSTGTGFTDYNPSTLWVDLSTDQSIYGSKTFYGLLSFNSGATIYLSATDFLNVSGETEFTQINDIVTDTSLSAASNNNLATALTIKTYVDTAIASAAGITGYTGNWVTTDTNQAITGGKTWNGYTVASTFTANTATITTDLIVSGNTIQSLTSYQYWGNEDTDGSYRMYVAPDTSLAIEKRESGTWTFKGSF